MSEIEFFAAGRPQTKGSTRSFVAQGRMVTKGANPKTKAWQGVIAHAAHEAGVRLIEGPVYVRAEFRFARPKGHFGTGRNAGVLKESADSAPVTRSVGDVDKLLRAVLDGLTGVAFADDSQVVSLVGIKDYLNGDGQSEGVCVVVAPAVTGGAS